MSNTKPSLKQWIFNRLGLVEANQVSGTQLMPMNQGVTIYPADNERTYLTNGYNKNAWVYSIVSKCAKKFSQVNFAHYKIKTKERKTYFEEYLPLTKNRLEDPLARIEAKRMLKKSVDQVMVDSALSKLLAKPNRNQTGAQFRESLYGYKLLSGEGNVWFSRLDKGLPPKEMFIIPKSRLALVKGDDPWRIAEYKLSLGGQEFTNPVENVLMWIFPSYEFDVYGLSHLRGMPPLNAGALVLQTSNEGSERLINMNKNQGVAGLAYRRDKHETPTATQALFQRQQFNSIVNDKDLAGSIASMNGDWGYIQFGLDAKQLQLIEQADVNFKILCNIFDIPWQLFGAADSYENRKQYKRDFVYDNIAVAAYSLRDEWNAKLIPEFNLDRERDVIDCDILSLPELGEDQDKQAAFLEKMGPRLSYNEGRELLGWDRSTDPNMDKHYIGQGMTTLEDLNSPIGDPLPDM